MKQHPKIKHLFLDEQGCVFSNKSGEIVEISGTIRKKDGYKQIATIVDGQAKSLLVHRLILETFSGFSQEGGVCCHNNGNPSDNRIENLRWGTQKDNSSDAIKHGTHPGFKNKGRKFSEEHRKKLRESHLGKPGPKGENQGLHKLTNEKVVEIRKQWEDGVIEGSTRRRNSMRKIAKENGVTHEAIRKIIRRETWNHI